MTTTETADLFGKNKSVLITNVIEGAGPVDIFIDASETITDIGHDIRKRHRGYADDMILQDWLSQKIWPLEAHLTGEDVYCGTKLACTEMIRTGTTAFNDMYFFMEDAARAVDEAGIRALLCYGFIDLSDAEKRERECTATEALVAY